MRSLVALTASAAILLTQVSFLPAFGQSAPTARMTATRNAVIEATFKAFPSGGEPLSMRIADLIAANPKLAAEFVVYIQSASDLNRAQKLAAEHGLAAAADRLGIRAQLGDAGSDPLAWVAALASIGVGAGGAAWGASEANKSNTNAITPSASRN